MLEIDDEGHVACYGRIMDSSRPRWPSPSSSATTTAASTFSPFAISADQWRTVLTEHPNVILQGTLAASDMVLKALQPGLARPIWRCCAGTGFTLPPGPGAFVLHQVSGLSLVWQARLLEWLTGIEEVAHVQVVSTTTSPIFPLVERAAFLPDLYLRLNGLTLDLGPVAVSG